MSRRKAAPKREILPDPMFRSELLAKFINHVMNSGKKSIAEKIVYGALEKISEQKIEQPIETDSEGGEGSSGSSTSATGVSKALLRALAVFEKALENVRPAVEVKSRRVGGATYQVPVEIRASRSMALAMRWLVDYAKGRSEKSMSGRLAGEIMDAFNSRGGAVKKREDTHRMAKANQAFAHYHW